MKNLKKLIKGLLITILFIGLFSLNVQPITQVNAKSIESQNVVTAEYTSADLFIPVSLAQNDDAGPALGTADNPVVTTVVQTPPNLEEILNSVAKASLLVNSVFNPMINFVTFQIGNFLNNDYIYGGNMGKMLNGIWVVNRNIVNIIFVMILLFLAIKHIFSSDENTDLKKVLPKFVIVLIAVNFTWLGTKLVLDAANVATNVVFAIPSGVKGVVGEDIIGAMNSGSNKCKIEDGKAVGSCKTEAVFYPADTKVVEHYLNCDETRLTNLNGAYSEEYPEEDDGSEKGTGTRGVATFCWKQLDIANFNHNNASYYLSYSMARIQNLTKTSRGNSIEKVAIGTVFSLMIQVVYLISFLALFIALIARVAALWFFVAFSPFLALSYYLSSGEIIKSDDLSKFSFQAMGRWAFAPAKVGAVWSVGFIMVTAGQTVSKTFFQSLDSKKEVITQTFDIESLFMGMSSIQELIWLLMTVGIIWIGTFAVLSKLEGLNKITEKINGYGKEFVSTVADIPKVIPFIPKKQPDGSIKMENLNAQQGPVGKLRAWQDKMNTRYGGGITNMRKLENLNKELTNKTGSLMVSLGTKDMKAAAGHLKSALGMDTAGITRNKAKITKMLKEKHPNLTDVHIKELFRYAELKRKDAVSAPAPKPAPVKTPPPAATSAETIAEGNVQAAKRLKKEGGSTQPVGTTGSSTAAANTQAQANAQARAAREAQEAEDAANPPE